jgi:hypothetical protein
VRIAILGGGSGQFLFSRVYVGDVAAAVSLALAGDHRGEAFNVVERVTAPYRLWAEQTGPRTTPRWRAERAGKWSAGPLGTGTLLWSDEGSCKALLPRFHIEAGDRVISLLGPPL